MEVIFMNEPLISVIIPSYNRAFILTDAINSVLQQTYKNIELLFVDDCSTDNTEEIVKNITDSRFHYIRLEKNSGACTARNRGIKEAKGDYIAFNDSDDQWHIDKLEKQLSFLNKNNADIVLCKMECKNNNGEFLHLFPNYTEDKSISYLSLLEYNCTSTQTLFGKTECFKKILFDDKLPRLQDWDEVLRLAQFYKIFFQNTVLVNTFMQTECISSHPEKGIAAMDMIFEKHKGNILMNDNILNSFFKKKAAFICKAGKNPVQEMKLLCKKTPSVSNYIRFIAAKTGIYKYLLKLKEKF